MSSDLMCFDDMVFAGAQPAEAGTPYLLSTDAEGDFHHEIGSEAVPEPFQDFLAPVPDDFAEPHVAIDVDKKRPLAIADRLGVRHHIRFNQVIPDL